MVTEVAGGPGLGLSAVPCLWGGGVDMGIWGSHGRGVVADLLVKCLYVPFVYFVAGGAICG